jgi:hypothetical protein
MSEKGEREVCTAEDIFTSWFGKTDSGIERRVREAGLAIWRTGSLAHWNREAGSGGAPNGAVVKMVAQYW